MLISLTIIQHEQLFEMIQYQLDKQANSSSKQKTKAFIIDSLLLLLLTFVFSLCTYKITQTTNTYSAIVNETNEHVNNIGEMGIEARLIKKTGDQKYAETDEIYQDYAIEHILLSYDLFTEEYQKAGLSNPHEHSKVKDKYTSMTLDKDYLEYYYISYIPSLPAGSGQIDYKDKTPREYFISLLSQTSDYSLIYDTSLEHPTFKADGGIHLYKVILDNSKESDDSKYNNILQNVFSNVYSNSIETFHNLNAYKEEYSKYSNSYSNLMRIFIYGYLVSFSFSAIIVYLLFPLIFNNGQTLGRKFFKIVLCNDKNEKLSFGRLLLRMVLDFIESFPLIIIPTILLSGPVAINISLFMIGSFGITLLILSIITLLFAFINMLFSIYKSRSLIDMASKSYSLDAELLQKF